MKKIIISLSIVTLLITSTPVYSWSPTEQLKKTYEFIVSYIPTQATFTTFYQKHPSLVKITVGTTAVAATAAIAYKYCPYVKEKVNTIIGKEKKSCRACGCTKPRPTQKPKPSNTAQNNQQPKFEEEEDNESCPC